MISASPRRLQVFKQVVDLGGFNAAAAHLRIAQPSVGAHVKALERIVGQALLQRRRGAKPQLTEAGRAVYELAVEVLRRGEETAQRLAGLKSIQSNEIVIAAHRDLALSFLPSRLAEFTRQSPRCRVVTRIGTIEDVLALVQARAVQLGVLLVAGPIRGIGSEIVGREPLDLVVEPDHPLASRNSVSSPMLASYPFVTGLRNSRYFNLVDGALRSIGIARYDVALELQEATAVKEAVRHGRSIACLPRCTISREISSGSLVALRLEQALPALQIRCVFAASPGQMARRLVSILRR